MAVAFDTHQYIKKLESVGVPEEQAEVTVAMFSEVLERREQIYRQNLASKQDLKEEITTLQIHLEQKIHDSQIHLEQKIHNSQIQLEQKLHDSTVSLIKWFTGIMIAQAGVIVALIKLL